jgi:hypothetical protein
MFALQNGSLKCSEFLIEIGIKPTEQCLNTAWKVAIEEGILVTPLIESDKLINVEELENLEDPFDVYPLEEAVLLLIKNGVPVDTEIRIPRVLLEKDTPNIPEDEDVERTSLLQALCFDNLPFAQKLINLGADLNRKMEDGRTFFEICCLIALEIKKKNAQNVNNVYYEEYLITAQFLRANHADTTIEGILFEKWAAENWPELDIALTEAYSKMNRQELEKLQRTSSKT